MSGAAVPAVSGSGPRAALADRLGALLRVRPAERRPAGYFFLLFVLIGAGLAIGRGTADALFFKRYGVEYLPLVYMAHAGLLFVATLTYAAVADLLAAERLFRSLFGALAVLLLAAWTWMHMAGVSVVYPLYYLLYEIASDLLVLHAGVYLAQNFETQQAKRLTPLVFAGAQLGGIGGGLLLAWTAGALGVSNLLVIWVALVLAALAILTRHHRRYGVSPHFRPGRRTPGAGRLFTQVGQGLAFARRSPLMRWSSLALFFTVVTFYTTSYAVSRIYAGAFATEDALTAFFGWLTMATGVAALLLQLLVTGGLLRRIGVRGVNLVFPASTVASLALLLASFTLPAALIASVNKDALMKAFRNPARSLLFNALPANMQGRARAVATGLVLPLALALTGGFLAVQAGRASPTVFLVAGLAAGVLYLFCNLQANRAYAHGILELLRARLFVGNRGIDELLHAAGPDAFEAVRRGVAHENDAIALAAARAMVERYPQHAAAAVLDRLPDTAIENRHRFVRLLAPLDSPPLRARLRAELPRADEHTRHAIHEWLIGARDESLRHEIASWLESPDARRAALAVHAVRRYPIPSLEERAVARLAELLRDAAPAARVAALAELACHPDRRHDADLLRQLAHDEVEVRLAALEALAVWPAGELPGLAAALDRPLRAPQAAIRRAAVRVLRRLPGDECRMRCRAALDDADAGVRELAAAGCWDGGAPGIEGMVGWLRGRNSPRSCATVLNRLLAERPARAVLEDVARALTDRAQEYIGWRTRLRRQPPAAAGNPAARQILLMALGERVRALVDLALTVIGAFDDPEAVRLIRAGLGSRDRRHVGSAREALRHIGDCDLANRLDAVLEAADLDGEADVRPDGDANAPAPLAPLATCGDPWLRACARQSLGDPCPEAA